MKMKFPRIAGRRPGAFLLLYLTASAAHAQDATSAVNEFLTGWVRPLFLGLIILAIIVGIIMEAENLIDKTGQGTRKQALINIGMYVVFAVLAGLIITTVINTIQGTDLSI